jgi:tetratricopeptide (TPR) repeat protein
VRKWDVTVQFLRFYVPLYYRITLGASRLQEVLADRLAVERYGSSAFIEGLHHVVSRDIEFQHLTSKAVIDAMRGAAATAAFYSPAKSIAGDDRLDVEAQTRDVMQLPTTELNSHPGLMDRITMARRIGVDHPLGPGTVLELFGEIVKQLARDMAKRINDDVAAQAQMLKERDQEILRKVTRSLDYEALAELLELRAAIYYRQGEVQKALDDLNTILTKHPGDLRTMISRADLYESEKQYEKAIDDLRCLRIHANKLPPDVRLKVSLRLATCWQRLKKMREAAAEFDEALRLAPNSLNAVLGRLQAAAAVGTLNEEREQELLRRAIVTWPALKLFDPLVDAAGLAELLAEQRNGGGLPVTAFA